VAWGSIGTRHQGEIGDDRGEMEAHQRSSVGGLMMGKEKKMIQKIRVRLI